jgi:hypothetical protein
MLHAQGGYMFEEQRLETFKEWPFNEDCLCSARKVQYEFMILACILYTNERVVEIMCKI